MQSGTRDVEKVPYRMKILYFFTESVKDYTERISQSAREQ